MTEEKLPIDITNLDHRPARTAYGEARNQGAIGMHAVLNVIQNRAKTPGWWGVSFDDCATKRDQFSCWNEGDPNREKIIEVDVTNRIFGNAVIMETLARRDALVDITNGADHYFNPKGLTKFPDWVKGRTPVAHIGDHVFYKIGLTGA